jgi:nucleotide-binding universal stress UspA family protein
VFQPRAILVATDFSEHSARVLEIAADLARQHSGKLFILHVAETLGPENVTFGEAAGQRQPEGYRQRLWDDLHTVRPPAEVPVEYVLAEGDPAHEITRIAQERNCDLIVLGTHGRRGLLERLLLGSVAEVVVRTACCPVLTIRSSN